MREEGKVSPADIAWKDEVEGWEGRSEGNMVKEDVENAVWALYALLKNDAHTIIRFKNYVQLLN